MAPKTANSLGYFLATTQAAVQAADALLPAAKALHIAVTSVFVSIPAARTATSPALTLHWAVHVHLVAKATKLLFLAAVL